MSIRQVIGIHSCKEALKVRTAKELRKIYVKKEWEQSATLRELVDLARLKGLKPETVSLKKLNRLTEHKEERQEGVCIELDHSFDWSEFVFSEDSTVLVLDRIQDPKNFGAIIRTAWLMGVDCIFISSKNSVGLTLSVVKTASGGVEHVPIFIKNNLRQCLEDLKTQAFWIYALDSHSHKTIWQENLKGRKALVLGGEAQGIRKNLKNICDELLFIPQKNKSASYNVSVATAIVLSETVRQSQQE